MITLSDIKPICIELNDEEKWVNRLTQAKEYFLSKGLDVYYVNGFHAERFGVTASRPYLRDAPDANWHLEQRTVGCNLSAYLVFSIAASHPEWEYIMYLEDDTRFHDDWKERFEQAMKDVPEDFDWLFLSHCCTEGRQTKHIKGQIYEVKYPQAGHCCIISQRAINSILKTCRDSCTPFDVLLFDKGFEGLNVYTLMPRLAEQVDTHLPQ